MQIKFVRVPSRSLFGCKKVFTNVFLSGLSFTLVKCAFTHFKKNANHKMCSQYVPPGHSRDSQKFIFTNLSRGPEVCVMWWFGEATTRSRVSFFLVQISNLTTCVSCWTMKGGQWTVLDQASHFDGPPSFFLLPGRDSSQYERLVDCRLCCTLWVVSVDRENQAAGERGTQSSVLRVGVSPRLLKTKTELYNASNGFYRWTKHRYSVTVYFIR